MYIYVIYGYVIYFLKLHIKSICKYDRGIKRYRFMRFINILINIQNTNSKFLTLNSKIIKIIRYKNFIKKQLYYKYYIAIYNS